MPIFNAPTDDIKFVLHEILKCETLSALPGYEDASADLIDQIIDEGSKLCQEELFPLNQSGDEEGCHFDNGTVTTPKGFQQAYDLFTEGGWVGLSCDPEYGGMGLPQLVNFVMQEIISAANMSFGMYPDCHKAHMMRSICTDQTNKKPCICKIIEGKWSGTMNLTEALRHRSGADPYKGRPRTGRGWCLSDHRVKNLHFRRGTRSDRKHCASGSGPPARCARRCQRHFPVCCSEIFAQRRQWRLDHRGTERGIVRIN